MLARHIFSVLLLSATVLTSDRSHAIDIDCTNGNVPDNAVGELMVDMDANCPGIQIGHNGTLMMNGHTVTGAVVCQGLKCTVIGPGVIVGGSAGIHAASTIKLIVTAVDVSGNGYGIYQPDGKLVATNVIANGNDQMGIVANKMILEQVTANNNGTSGIGGILIKATGVTVNGNGADGIAGDRRLKVTGGTANGNGMSGFNGQRRCKLKAVDATGNQYGVTCATGFVLESTLTGNTVADIIAGPNGPKVRDTTCDNSFRPTDTAFPGPPAGLCASN